MTPGLKDELCQYLGELICDNEKEFDWIKKALLIKKIYAINVLLDMHASTEQTFSDAVAMLIKNEQQHQSIIEEIRENLILGNTKEAFKLTNPK